MPIHAKEKGSKSKCEQSLVLLFQVYAKFSGEFGTEIYPQNLSCLTLKELEKLINTAPQPVAAIASALNELK